MTPHTAGTETTFANTLKYRASRVGAGWGGGSTPKMLSCKVGHLYSFDHTVEMSYSCQINCLTHAPLGTEV